LFNYKATKFNSTDNSCRQYDQQSILRDLFLWSVNAGNDGIAFVLLLHLKSRIGPALIAAVIAKRISLEISDHEYLRHTFRNQADNYANYATQCIEDCQKYNEQYACELLLRERLLYGNATYMQVRRVNIYTHYYLFQNRI
jgi:hypothetical protein